MAFKFLAIIALFAAANGASTTDFNQLNRNLQQQQEQQQQLNYELQSHQNQMHEQMNQKQMEEQQRHHMEQQRQIQQLQEMQKQQEQQRQDDSNVNLNTQNIQMNRSPAISTQHFQRNHRLHFDSHPQYEFGYSVHDGLSGDIKSQQERRNGDRVEGQYSVIDSDGFSRTVEYTADDAHGFRTNVHRSPITLLTPTFAVHLNEADRHHNNQANTRFHLLTNKDAASLLEHQHRIATTN